MIALLLAPFIIGILFTYEVIKVPIPSDMERNLAVDYEESPRLAPPQGAVPIGGQSVIPEEFPTNPIPADDISLQRGKILYDIHCLLCHGPKGQGDGPLAEEFARTPENLVGTRARAEFDGSVYLAIQSGFGEMPSLAENLTVRERWDVVNYIRTFPEAEE
jgi:mono/diheme cytochrome c family protein